MKGKIKKLIIAEFGTQVALARWMGVTRQAVNQWLSGKQHISVKHAMMLAKRLDVDWLDEFREDLK
jgi:DNA-binding transcriptional regulator YdaS (Cro superfamily)